MHSSAPGSLTPRQAEIAAMVARGESNREIANALELSTRTVETHIVSIFNKLGVRSRVELAVALLANPASDPLDSVLNNLPRRPSMFIGREREIGEIRALVESQQLVTLVGSAGVGKTTTSLRVAETMLDEFPDGVWFVELASLPRGDYVPAAVARVLDLTLSVDEPMRSLAKRLASRRTLLLFDNCEHLVEPVAAAIATILRACSNVKILASSRHRLEIAGEATYRVPSLSVPGQVAGAKPGAAEVLRYEAATLFVERATAADNRFTLTNDNAFSIADICRRLDGIPLAIELAAARTNILSPQQLCAQLGERFRLLTGGSRDAMARHQTLRSLIDWSYDLLDERERVFFRRFGIFVNGFTLDGASAVAGSALDEEAVFAVITSLVDKSLLLAEPVGDAMRYRMLESTSAYARERLDEASESRQIVERHVRYMRDRFVAAAKACEASGRSSDMSGALETELGNVRAVLDAALEGFDTIAGAEMLAAIDYAWNDIGMEREGRMRTEAFLERLGDDDSPVVARLSVVLARSAGSFRQGSRAVELARLAVERARSVGDPAMLSEALTIYSWNAAATQRFAEAEAAMLEAERFPFASVRLRLAMLNTRAFLSYHAKDYAAAAELFERLRDRHRALHNPSRERMVMLALAEVEYNLGYTQRAIDTVTEILLGVEKGRYRLFRASLLSNLAGYMVSVGNCAEAISAAREAIAELGAHDPEAASVINAMQHLALALVLGGDTSRAATLAGYVDAANDRFGHRREPNELASRDRLMSLLQENVGLDDLTRMLSDGSALPSETAIELARAEVTP